MTVANPSSPEKEVPPSALSPFRYPAFTILWTAGTVSNVGTWMHEVGAGWLMTELDPDPLMVSLVRAGTTLPVFLFAMLAGAIADRVQKRAYLFAVSFYRLIVALILAAIVYYGHITPWILLGLTLLMGIGAAFTAPAWLSVVPSLVPKDKLQPAVALNSLGINISRAIGPAIAGVLILSYGLHAPFLVNAISFIVILGALLFWESGAAKPEPSGKSLLSEIKRGFAEGRTNRSLQRTLLHAVSFFTFASAFWALLPLTAKSLDPNGADLFGLLMASVGVGAIGGAFLIPKWRKMISLHAISLVGKLHLTAALVMLGTLQTETGSIAAAFIGGIGWITVMTCNHTSTQIALEDEIRARGTALMLMVVFGSLSFGAALWGQVAKYLTLAPTQLLAASLMGAIAIVMYFAVRLGPEKST